MQAQTETQNGINQQRICFIDQVCVNHLHSGCRKDSNKQPAVHPILQQPQRSKYLLAQMDFLDHLLYDAYSYSVTASESFSITDGYVRNSQHLQNPLCVHWLLIQGT
jgi:hypothetical protein